MVKWILIKVTFDLNNNTFSHLSFTMCCYATVGSNSKMLSNVDLYYQSSEMKIFIQKIKEKNSYVLLSYRSSEKKNFINDVSEKNTLQSLSPFAGQVSKYYSFGYKNNPPSKPTLSGSFCNISFNCWIEQQSIIQ